MQSGLTAEGAGGCGGGSSHCGQGQADAACQRKTAQQKPPQLPTSGYSVQTQIQMDYLRHDGFHISKQFESVVDKTYACALMGVPVPNPTPVANFEPDYI